QETKVTDTWLHLGINPDTGEDEEILKGKPYREVVTNDQGAIYHSTETKWERRWLCGDDAPELVPYLPSCALYPNKDAAKEMLVALAVQTAVLEGSWEKTTTPRYVLQTMAYDLWGHVSETDSYGEVGFLSPRAVGD